MKVHSKWLTLQSAMRKLNLKAKDRFCLESKRVPYHRIIRGTHGEVQLFAVLNNDCARSYLLGIDFEPQSLYRVVEDPELIERCMKKEGK